MFIISHYYLRFFLKFFLDDAWTYFMFSFSSPLLTLRLLFLFYFCFYNFFSFPREQKWWNIICINHVVYIFFFAICRMCSKKEVSRVMVSQILVEHARVSRIRMVRLLDTTSDLIWIMLTMLFLRFLGNREGICFLPCEKISFVASRTCLLGVYKSIIYCLIFSQFIFFLLENTENFS